MYPKVNLSAYYHFFFDAKCTIIDSHKTASTSLPSPLNSPFFFCRLAKTTCIQPLFWPKTRENYNINVRQMQALLSTCCTASQNRVIKHIGHSAEVSCGGAHCFGDFLPSRGIRRCALSAEIRSRHASVAAAHAHRMPCRVPGVPQNSAHHLRFTREPFARRSGGGDAVSRDARSAPRHFGAKRGAVQRAERAAHGGRVPRNSTTPQRRKGGFFSTCMKNAVL